MSLVFRILIGLSTAYVLFIFVLHLFATQATFYALGLDAVTTNDFQHYSVRFLQVFLICGTIAALVLGLRNLRLHGLGYALLGAAAFTAVLVIARFIVGPPLESAGLWMVIILSFDIVVGAMLTLRR